jgi:hypothetical protein
VRELRRLNHGKLKEVSKKLRKIADYVILDSAAGLGEEAIAAMEAADEMIIVTNPEIPAVTGTYTARRASATTGGATFTIDATQKISTANNLRLQASTYYSLYWDEVVTNPSQGLIYATDMINAVTGEVILEKTNSFGNSRSFIDVEALDKTRSYKLRVFVQPQSATANTTPFVGVSVKSLILDFRPIVNQVRTRGGTTAGGNSVILEGAFFDINTKVFFGTTEATSITLNGTASMTVTAPAGSVGTVDITLQNARGTSIISDNTKYTYYAISTTTAIQPKNLTRGSNGVVYFLDVISSSSNVLSLLQISATTAPVSLAIPNAAFYEVRDVAVDESNNVWISFSNKFVKVTPNNTISELAMPTGVSPAAFVFNAGYIWFLRTDSGKIGKMLPDGTGITEFAVPSGSFGSSSFSTSNDFVIGPDGNLWFTQQYGGLGRITPTGAITVLSNVNQSNAKILVHDNALWLNSGYSSIQRVTTDGTVTNTSTCGGNHLAVGADNYFWCGASFAINSAFLNRQIISNTQTNVLAQSIGIGNTTSSQISDLISDSSGKIWYINGNRVGVLTP